MGTVQVEEWATQTVYNHLLAQRLGSDDILPKVESYYHDEIADERMQAHHTCLPLVKSTYEKNDHRDMLMHMHGFRTFDSILEHVDLSDSTVHESICALIIQEKIYVVHHTHVDFSKSGQDLVRDGMYFAACGGKECVALPGGTIKYKMEMAGMKAYAELKLGYRNLLRKLGLRKRNCTRK